MENINVGFTTLFNVYQNADTLKDHGKRISANENSISENVTADTQFRTETAETIKDVRSTIEANKAEHVKDVENITTKVNDNKATYDNFVQETYTKFVEKTDTDIKDINSSIAESNANIDVNKQEIEKSNAAIEANRQEIEMQKTSLNNFKEHVAATYQTKEDAASNMATVEANYFTKDSINKMLESYYTRADVDENLKANYFTKNETNAAIAKVDERAANIESDNAKHLNDFNLLSTRVDDLDKKKADRTEVDTETLKNKLDSVYAPKNDLYVVENINDPVVRKSTLNKRLVGYKDELNTGYATDDELDSARNTLLQAIADSTSKESLKTTLEGEYIPEADRGQFATVDSLSKVQTETTNANAEVQSAKSLAQNTAEELTKVENEIASKANVADLENYATKTDLNSYVTNTTFASKVREITTAVEQDAGDIQALKESVSKKADNSQLGKTNSDISDLRNEVANLPAGGEINPEELKKLVTKDEFNNEINTQNSKNESLELKLNSANARIKSNVERIDKVEKKVTTLENKPTEPVPQTFDDRAPSLDLSSLAGQKA